MSTSVFSPHYERRSDITHLERLKIGSISNFFRYMERYPNYRANIIYHGLLFIK
jgi:hypothetical protein